MLNGMIPPLTQIYGSLLASYQTALEAHHLYSE